MFVNNTCWGKLSKQKNIPTGDIVLLRFAVEAAEMRKLDWFMIFLSSKLIEKLPTYCHKKYWKTVLTLYAVITFSCFPYIPRSCQIWLHLPGPWYF